MSAQSTGVPVEGSAPQANEQQYDATLQYLEEQAANSPLSENLQVLPSYIARGLVYLLLAFLTVSLLYAALARIDIIREALAKVVPEGNLQNIQADCDGIVRQLLVKEGDDVEEDAALVEIDSREVVAQIAALRKAEHELDDAQHEMSEIVPMRKQQIDSQQQGLVKKLEGLIQSRQNLERRLSAERRGRVLAAEARAAEMDREEEDLQWHCIDIENAADAVELAEVEYHATETLKRKGGVSDLQSRSAKRALEQAQADAGKSLTLAEESRKLQVVSARKYASVEHGFEMAEADLLEELRQNEIARDSVELELDQKRREKRLLQVEAGRNLKLAEFEAKRARDAVALSFPGINQAELDKLIDAPDAITSRTILKAPVAGRIGKMLVRNAGEAVERRQLVLTLIPRAGALRAELQIKNQDVGRVVKRMEELAEPDDRTPPQPLRVRFKFDAFPYAEHGAIEGELTEVITDTEGDSSGRPVYRAYASIDQDYILIKGQKAHLLPGMTATAEIITEQKTLLELMLTPLREQFTPRKADRGQP